jgi:hypothetical protein
MVKCGIEEGTCGRSGGPESGAEAYDELSRRLSRNRRGKLVATGFIMGEAASKTRGSSRGIQIRIRGMSRYEKGMKAL